MFDFRMRHLEISGSVWIVGISEGELLAIVLQNDAPVPLLTQKSQIRRFPLKTQMLAQEAENIDSKEMTLS